MKEYFTRTPERHVTQLYHIDDRQTPISTIHYAYEKHGLLGPKDKQYRVTNQPNVAKKPFQSLESAVAHSVAVHRQKADPTKHHPIVKVSHHINALGDSIEAASSHPHTTDHHQSMLLDVTKAYVALVDVFNKHFGGSDK